MARNEIGHSHQRTLHSDIMTLIEDGPIDMQNIVIELGETWQECRRQVNQMQAERLVVIDKESDNWIVEVMV